jgi:tripeptidyl-peptidase I
MTMRISLKQPNFNKLEEHLYAVSDPESPRYGQHLSKEQVQELVAPSSDGLRAVNDWLASMGFDVAGLVRSPSMDWLKIETTVKLAEEMLNTVTSHYALTFHNLDDHV